MSARRLVIRLTLIACAALATACSPSQEPQATTTSNVASDLETRAQDIALSSIIVDTHIDVPYRLEEEWTDVSEATAGGDFDYPRAVEGGLNVAFMSIYTPAELEREGKSFEMAEQLIDMVEGIVAAAPEKFAIALSPDDVEAQFEKGLISLPLGMENGSPIEGDLANVQHFYDRGIRYITLAHGLSNHISDSSYDDNRQWGGLSDFGVEVVREMNRLGIMVDVSHISDDAFYDVMEATQAPVIASHSSARHFTPGFERNMSDEMIAKLAENGGVIMINFGSSFLTAEANAWQEAYGEAWDTYAAGNGGEPTDEMRDRFRDQYTGEHGKFPYATLDETLDHFDHVVQLTSVENVGIGSDFDGVGDSLPIGLKDVSAYPNLVKGLLKRGYSEADIAKILGENLLRVWRDVEEAAAKPQAAE
jgi:membrane dipeptidase